jgi:ribosomal-protein-alanine N-acetyltransferase
VTAVTEGEVARGSRVVLREKRMADAADDYRWRADRGLARYDATRPFMASFDEYLALYRDDLVYPNPYRRSLAIEDLAGRHIGNAMYYNIDVLRQQAEVGITIGERECWNQGYGSEAVRLLVGYLLAKKGFRRLHLKTLEWNHRARRCFEKAGLVEYGRRRRGGQEFILMEFRREWLWPEKT